LLILAGAVNGLILPLALAVILVASVKRKIVGDYKHPLWMQFCGWLVVAAMSWMGWITVKEQLARLFQ
jgi:Mn2+/Fe2+ NRAMP family transporter